MRRSILTFLISVLLFSISLSPRLSIASAAGAREQPIASAQVPAGVEGNWLGTLEVGGAKLRLMLKISKSPDGKLTATVDSLDQNVKDIPVDTITFQDGILKLAMNALSASYVGTQTQYIKER